MAIKETGKRTKGESRTFESLLNVDGLFSTGLEVGDTAFRLAERHGAFR